MAVGRERPQVIRVGGESRDEQSAAPRRRGTLRTAARVRADPALMRRVAEQANGAVIIRAGDTVVLCTATMARAPREGVDFVPLTCDYE